MRVALVAFAMGPPPERGTAKRRGRTLRARAAALQRGAPSGSRDRRRTGANPAGAAGDTGGDESQARRHSAGRPVTERSMPHPTSSCEIPSRRLGFSSAGNRKSTLPGAHRPIL
jgi:hypothetical protein